MLHNWFTCIVKYDKTLANGMRKIVTESYLVDSLSYTEAEVRIIEEVTPFMNGELSIGGIKRAKISELFFDETGDIWYKCKVNFISLDAKSGMEKKTSSTMLVQASSLENALKGLLEGMKGTLADYEITSIAETQIMDIFPFKYDNE